MSSSSWVNFLVLVTVIGSAVLSYPVSFPDRNSAPQQQQVFHRIDNNNNYAPSEAITENKPEESTSNITPPPEKEEEEQEEENTDQIEPTIEDLVNRAPIIWNNIQNYINSAINSYSANETAPNQPPAQLNQFLGLVDGFINVTNSFAQQFLETAPTTTTSGATAAAEAPVENEIVYNGDAAKSNDQISEKKVKT